MPTYVSGYSLRAVSLLHRFIQLFWSQQHIKFALLLPSFVLCAIPQAVDMASLTYHARLEKGTLSGRFLPLTCGQASSYT
jgi:hypothetical protein